MGFGDSTPRLKEQGKRFAGRAVPVFMEGCLAVWMGETSDDISFLYTDCLTSCTAVFIWYEVGDRVLGACLHYNSQGDPAERVEAELLRNSAVLANVRRTANCYITTGWGAGTTAPLVVRSFKEAGYKYIFESITKTGSACLDYEGGLYRRPSE